MISCHTSFIIQLYASVFIHKIVPPSTRFVVFACSALPRRSSTRTPFWSKIFVFWYPSSFIPITFRRCCVIRSLTSSFPPRKWRDLICWAFGRMLIEGWKLIVGSGFWWRRHGKLHAAISSWLRGGRRLKVLCLVHYCKGGCRWGTHIRRVWAHAVFGPKPESTTLLRILIFRVNCVLMGGNNDIRWGTRAHDPGILFLAGGKVGRLQRVPRFRSLVHLGKDCLISRPSSQEWQDWICMYVSILYIRIPIQQEGCVLKVNYDTIRIQIITASSRLSSLASSLNNYA